VSEDAVIGFVAGFGFGVLLGIALSAFAFLRATLFLARLGRALQEKRRKAGSENRRSA